jgi:transcriptional regulator with XRE-family HTH domain
MAGKFGFKLRAFRMRMGISQNVLAQRVGVDASYINRIEKDERVPAREVIIALATTLSLKDYERDDLLLSADYAPEIAERLDLADPEFRLMAEKLNDDDMQPEDLLDQLIAMRKQRRLKRTG